MGKRANLLKHFKNYNDDQILNFIKETINKHLISKKSEEVASTILKHYNKTASFIKRDNLERDYYRIMQYIKIKELAIPDDWFDVNISIEYVIDKIYEARYLEVKWIDQHCYLFDNNNNDISYDEAVENEFDDFDKILKNIQVDFEEIKAQNSRSLKK